MFMMVVPQFSYDPKDPSNELDIISKVWKGFKNSILAEVWLLSLQTYWLMNFSWSSDKKENWGPMEPY